MSKKILVGAIAAVMCLALMALAADEKPWFDMEKCGMCMHLTKAEGLLQHMTWDQAKISNGFVAVATVEPDFMTEYKKVDAMMNETAAKLMADEEMYLCGSCDQMGTFFMKGAKMEEADLANGDIMLVTSDNQEVVAEMHAYVDKNKEEMKKMMSTMTKEKKADTK